MPMEQTEPPVVPPEHGLDNTEPLDIPTEPSPRSLAEKSSKPEPLDLPTRPWYKNMMAIIGALAALVAIVSGLYTVIPHREPQKFAQNTIILFDSSAAMNDRFGTSTKLQALKNAFGIMANGTADKDIGALGSLGNEVAAGDNVALWNFGGPCKGENSRQLIDFGPNTVEHIKDAVRGLKAEGETTITQGMINAVGAFNDVNRFGGVDKRIIVITGGTDSCETQPAKWLENRLMEKGIKASFRFIGMSPTSEQQEQLRLLADKTGGLAVDESRLFFVYSEEELQKVLNQVLNEADPESVIADMLAIIDTVRAPLNVAKDAANSRDYPALEKALAEAERAFKDQEKHAKDRLEGQWIKDKTALRPFQDQLQRVQELTKLNRDYQQQLILVERDEVFYGKGKNTDALNKSTDKWNEILRSYNKNIEEIDKTRREIARKRTEHPTP